MITTLVAVRDRVAKRWSHPIPVESVDAFKRDLALALSKMDDSETLKACREDYDVYAFGVFDDTASHSEQPLRTNAFPEFCFSLDQLEVK